jgi:uroporphyrin-III C-methyltransferase
LNRIVETINKMAGTVYLVGAGPGDPELLTRRAWRVLQSADVVLHDGLVPREVLATLPPTAQVVNVGKRCGAKSISQEEINALMVQLAREGKTVARLKSGDPLLFGRAGEEIDALRRAGVEFEIVPGVTAALGAAASAQISLTDRRHASRIVFVTAHREGGTGLTNEGHIVADTTYVIYMPGGHYSELAAELQAAGFAADIPCVVISRATTDEETISFTTVARLPERPKAASPSLIIVGLVVAAANVAATEGEGNATRLNDELLQLGLQHPLFGDPGRSGVE